ncbi:MAG: glycosyltransferase family 39 protein [Chitinophagaceae bacterium]|nr:glycosyltransferase family 39 protein [Chitinophagaceae bacterium]
MRSPLHTSLFAAGLLAIYLINGLLYLPRQSITYDEISHLNFGVRVLKGSTQRTDRREFNSKMPVSALNALPRAFEQLRNRGLQKTDNGVSDVMHGRYITLFISLLIGVFVFKWASELYGERAGLFSLFLFVFCPNCLAHAALVTTDTYSVLLLLLVMYYLWKWLSFGVNKDFILFCVFTGVAQLVKQSLFHLYVIIPCLVLVWFFMRQQRKVALRPLLVRVGVFVLINLLVINAGFYFQGFGRSLGAYHFRSDLFQGVQRSFSFLSSVPLPLPSSFIEGLDMAKYYESLGGGLPDSTFGNVTILGHSSTQGTFWYFYFVVFFFKTPIPVLVFLTWSCWRLVQKRSRREIARNELFLLLPVLYFLILMDFFYKVQINIRHIIFIYPLLYVFCGIIIRYLSTAWEKWGLALLSVWYIVSVLSYFRNYIPYTNEFIPDKKMAYNIVGADNLNYGQGVYFLQDYLAAHPDVTMAAPTPRPGRQAIAINDFLDIWNEHRYDWLKPFKPVGHIAHYYLIFDITPDEINKR